MARSTCCICGKNLNLFNSNIRYHKGEELPLCSHCFECTENRDEKSVSYLREMSCRPDLTPAAKSYLTGLVGSTRTGTSSSSSKPVPAAPASRARNSAPAGSAFEEKVLVIAGIVFLIASIVFYAISIRDVGSMQVANMQSTVFCAANFIVSMVCFACRIAISALKKR